MRYVLCPILYRTSFIFYPLSHTVYPLSYIQIIYLPSDLRYPTPYIRYQISDFLYPISRFLFVEMSSGDQHEEDAKTHRSNPANTHANPHKSTPISPPMRTFFFACGAAALPPAVLFAVKLKQGAAMAQGKQSETYEAANVQYQASM